MNIFDKVEYYLKAKLKKPECFEDENFLYCWCGKCETKIYELPDDIKRIIAIETAKHYKSN